MMEQAEKSKEKTSCAECGKTIAASGNASLTAWLFRQADCRCEEQKQPDGKPAHPGAQEHEAALQAAPGQLERLEVPLSLLSYTYAAGDLIGDYFEVIEAVGQGGMGEVYRVVDRRTQTVFALKVISPRLGEQRILAKRLEHEALTAKALTHANIASIYDVGRGSDGAPFLIMDYVAGKNMEQLLQSEVLLQGDRALNLFIQVAEALLHAHSKGVIHRDLKPSNILLSKTEDGPEIVKLVDFGIAKISDAHRSDQTKLTQTGELIGSPLYMSPEQCRGDELDERSDIYSLGCIMYEVVSGRSPFCAENPVRVLLKHLSEPAPRLSINVRISEGFKSVIERCLMKKPADRYQSAAALLQDLLRIRDGKQLPLMAQLRLSQARLLPKARRLALLPLGALLILAAVFCWPKPAPDLVQTKRSKFDRKIYTNLKSHFAAQQLRERAAVKLAGELQARGWSVEQAAKYFGSDPALLDALLNGKNSDLSMDELNSMALALGISQLPSGPETTEEKQEMVSYYTRAIEHDPGNARAYAQRAEAYSALGKYDLEAADYTTQLALQPQYKYSCILGNRAAAYQNAGKSELALNDINEILRHDPGANIYQNRGIIWQSLGQYAKALSDDTEAIRRLDIPRPGPYLNRANVYMKLARIPEAIADLEKCLQIDPTYESIRKKIAELRTQEKEPALKKTETQQKSTSKQRQERRGPGSPEMND